MRPLKQIVAQKLRCDEVQPNFSGNVHVNMYVYLYACMYVCMYVISYFRNRWDAISVKKKTALANCARASWDSQAGLLILSTYIHTYIHTYTVHTYS